MPPPYIIFWSMNVFHFAVKSITYRYGADRSIYINREYSRGYLHTRRNRLPTVHRSGTPCIHVCWNKTARLHNNFRLITGNASSPNVKERVLLWGQNC